MESPTNSILTAIKIIIRMLLKNISSAYEFILKSYVQNEMKMYVSTAN